uniref:Uncharacterized protein n=1 Tax=Arundo donax TaxID=35708 RepID=A0A0A8ZV87_ARUDO
MAAGCCRALVVDGSASIDGDSTTSRAAL